MTTTLNASTSSGLVMTPDNSGNIQLQWNGVAAPAFSATGTGQSISSSTWTKIEFTTEQFDTASCFDSSTNYRFTPTVAGYYQINLSAGHGASGNNVLAAIYRNGTQYQVASAPGTTSVYDPAACVSCVIYFNGSTDYVEGYIITNTNTSTQTCRFSGCLLRGA